MAWGKAGVRLTPAEAAARASVHRSERNRLAAIRAQHEATARREWEAGLVVPWRITHALDFHKLDGPEVDEACGAREPDVDRWELGELYPTWEQLLLLSKLTHYPVRFFLFHRVKPIHPLSTSLRFHLPAHELADWNPVLRCPEHVWRPVVARAEESADAGQS